MSVWVEIFEQRCLICRIMSRSTWACELKSINWIIDGINGCHAPRERVSWNEKRRNDILCEVSHAPRERVSWNVMDIIFMHKKIKSRSTWACELKSNTGNARGVRHVVTLHVSVWVEIFVDVISSSDTAGHAPRERVSWNLIVIKYSCRPFCHAPRERVSWNIRRLWRTNYSYASRSTWACELKCFLAAAINAFWRHAPRERVSWNENRIINIEKAGVTLHVSVWVEICLT